MLTTATLLAGAPAIAASPAISTQAMRERVAPCMACHGSQGRATADGYYPRIAGKPAGYLYNQLLNFRDGRRQQYPLMTYTVQYLSDDYLHQMAIYFAGLHLPYPPPQKVDVAPEVLQRGRVLATAGESSRQIPACVACHGVQLTGLSPSIPGLLGLPRDYINAQFGAWRGGARRAQAPDCMAQIAKQLTVEDISAVSAWLASQPVPPNPTPDPGKGIKLPLPCGSFQQ